MSFKEGCGFREKADVCGFKAEDCNKGCDFYDLEYSIKAIKKRSKEEQKNVITLTDDMKEFKKQGFKKTNPEGYKKIKNERKDKVIGMMKLSKAYVKLKRSKK